MGGLVREHKRLEKTVSDLNSLLSTSKNKNNLIAELAFLKSFTSFTNFLEAALITAVLSSKQFTYISAKDEEHARELLSYGKRDGEILTYPVDACKVADKIFKDRHPFLKKMRQSRSTLEECNTIRNYISHDSVNSKLKFENLVRTRVKGSYLPNQIKTAGDFLLYFDSSINSTFLTYYLDVMLDISKNAKSNIVC